MWLLWSNGCSLERGRVSGCSCAGRSTMDIGREQKPYVLEPIEDPVPSEERVPDEVPSEETPAAVPEEVTV